MPAPEFIVVDAAYEKVRNAYAAKSDTDSEVAETLRLLSVATDRADAAKAKQAPLQEVYLAAVQELIEAIQALKGV